MPRPGEKDRGGGKLPAIGGYFGTEGVKPTFVTQTIEATLRRRAVFNCGQEQVLLWGAPKEEDVQEIKERLQFVCSHVLDRVDAEFDQPKQFAMFDVPAVREAYGCTRDEGGARKQRLNRYVRHFATALRVDACTAAQEYGQIAQLICNLTSPGQPLATKRNNEVWSAMLRPNVYLSHFPQRKKCRPCPFSFGSTSV